jgi:Lon-like protease
VRRLLVALLLGGLATFVVRGGVPCEIVELPPGCYVALTPGPAEDAASLVEIDGAASYTSSGQLLLTTVAVEEDLGLDDWVRSVFNADIDTVPSTTLFPPGAERDEVTRQNTALMVDSQLAATVVALRRAGYDIPEEFDGARVEQVHSEAAAEVLEVGDVIVGVDGRPTTDPTAVAEAISRREPGEVVELEVRRDGEELAETVRLGDSPEDPGRAFLGVLLVSHLELPLDVVIDAGVIGGPSAGLMFALSIVDLLDPEDLTGGTVVAGTGILAGDGTVGAVGGVRQKVVGAATPGGDRRPASVFLVPADNLEQVEDVALSRDLLVVPVATLDDALEAVADVREGRRPPGSLALGTD